MCRERVSLGLLLRVGVLLTAVCVFLHVYLQSSWQGAPHLLSLGHLFPTQNGDQQSRQKVADGGDVGVKRQISYIYHNNNKRESLTRRRNEERGQPTSSCCPSPHRRRKTFRWHIDLEPWASERHSLEDEAKRFLHYISTPQVSCASVPRDVNVKTGCADGWCVCLDPQYSLFHRTQSKHCRMYSFGLGGGERILERSLASSGCEVHCFDPSLKQPHLQEAEMWVHRLSVDWRDPNPAIAAQRQHTTTKKLATILNDFGHREVDVLKADMESAEWKILENLLLEGVLDSVGQLLLELHLHWAGFEVGGDDPSVVRYWFSLLKELERAQFSIFHVHSDPTKPKLFLHKNILNASSSYTLSWLNTKWKPA